MCTAGHHPREDHCFSSHSRRADHPFSQCSPVHLLLVVRYGGGFVAGQSCPTLLIQAIAPSCQQWILGIKLAVMHVLWLYHACGRADGTKLFSCYQNSVIMLCIFSPLCYLQKGG